jgi:ribosomal protein S18 acetylase RimI-like enzyme
VRAPITIRPARTSDLDDLVQLLALLFAIEEDFAFDAERQRQGLALLLDTATAVVLVAEAEGRVVGMCSGQLTVSTAEGGPALLVEDVVVASPWQGRGVGRHLLVALEQWAGARKIGRLQLLADRTNRAALDFYKAVGWQGTELICLRKRLPAAIT